MAHPDIKNPHGIVAMAVVSLAALDGDTVDVPDDNEIESAAGDTRMPFTARTPCIPFRSQTSVSHAGIAYAILRAHGVNLGKRDSIGFAQDTRYPCRPPAAYRASIAHLEGWAASEKLHTGPDYFVIVVARRGPGSTSTRAEPADLRCDGR